jgi:hypothetical protein
VVGGYYAMHQREWLKVQAILPKLPELRQLLTELEKQIKELRANISNKEKGERHV